MGLLAPVLASPAHAAIVQHDYTLVDSSRPTPCTGAPDRTLHVSVFVPDGTGPFPVMLVAPGSGASERPIARADAAAFAARGYVGVAVPFPCTNAPGETTLDPVVALDIYRQPADVSFVLDELLTKSATPADELFGLLDADRIGLTGTSSGGVTGLLFFNTCCTDTRIDAIVVSHAFAIPTGPDAPRRRHVRLVAPDRALPLGRVRRHRHTVRRGLRRVPAREPAEVLLPERRRAQRDRRVPRRHLRRVRRPLRGR